MSDAPVLIVGGGHRRTRSVWRMSIVGSAEPRELSRDEIHDAIRRAVGDAAHAMSPTGGFGMNRGIAWRADVAPPHPLAIIDRVRGV